MRGWIWRRVERHIRQMAAMMARVGVEAEEAAGQGRTYEAATRRCLWCPVAASCRQWLDDPAGEVAAMPFACPNTPFFEGLRSKRL